MNPPDELQVFPEVTMPAREREMWRRWFRKHGIDPALVCLPGAVWRYPAARRIVVEMYERDEDGGIAVNAAKDDGVRVRRTVQLESPPMPFPDVLPSGVRAERYWQL